MDLVSAAATGDSVRVRALLATEGPPKLQYSRRIRGSFGTGTPLLLAAQNGHADVVSALLASSHYVDINRPNAANETPLSFAADRGHTAVVAVLLAAPGIDANHTVGECGSTPLTLAADRGHVEVVDLLLRAAAINVNHVNRNDFTALLFAAQEGHTAVVAKLLTAPGISVNQAHRNGFTPLYLAARRGHTETITILLAHPGVEVNQADSHGRTPLYHAAQEGHMGVVAALMMDPRVDCSKSCYRRESLGELVATRAADQGDSPLNVARRHGHVQVAAALQARCSAGSPGALGSTDLFRAAKEGDAESIRSTLLATPDLARQLLVNEPGSHGFPWQTPLSVAAEKGHTATIIALLTTPGINVNQATKHGRTPLLLAAQNGHHEAVTALLSCPEIKVNQVDGEGNTPLYYAVQKAHAQVVAALVASPHTDVNKTVNNGTYLTFAAKAGNADVVTKLLAAPSINVNQANLNGATPLTHAAQNGHAQVAAALIAQPNIQVNQAHKKNGFTPLLLAARQGHAEVVKQLLSAPDIDSNQANLNGRTPLLLAAQEGHADVVALLLAVANIQVNKRDKKGCTPLDRAIRLGHTQVAAALRTAAKAAATGGSTTHITDSSEQPQQTSANQNGKFASDSKNTAGKDKTGFQGATSPKLPHISPADQAKVDAICAMGFPAGEALFAFQKAKKNVEAAVELLLSTGDGAVKPAKPDPSRLTMQRSKHVVLPDYAEIAQAPLLRGKIFFVGRGRSGKSSTFKSLKKGEIFDPLEQSTAGAQHATLSVLMQEDVHSVEWKTHTPLGQLRQRAIAEECRKFIAGGISEENFRAKHSKLPARILRMVEQSRQARERKKKKQASPASPKPARTQHSAISFVLPPSPPLGDTPRQEGIARAAVPPASNAAHASRLPALGTHNSIAHAADQSVKSEQPAPLDEELHTLISNSDFRERATVYSIWDFGGQNLFFPVHHVFLSAGGVYLVVVNLKELLLEPGTGISSLIREEVGVSKDGTETQEPIYAAKNSKQQCLDDLRAWLTMLFCKGLSGKSVLVVCTCRDAFSKAQLLDANEQIAAVVYASPCRDHVFVPQEADDELGEGLDCFFVDNTKGAHQESGNWAEHFSVTCTLPLSHNISPCAPTCSVCWVVSVPRCVLPCKHRKTIATVVQTHEVI